MYGSVGKPVLAHLTFPVSEKFLNTAIIFILSLAGNNSGTTQNLQF